MSLALFGMGTPGFTSQLWRATISPPLATMIPISTIASVAASRPVVSVSSIAME